MKCRVCGCTEFDPCQGVDLDTGEPTVCAWAEPGLCTFCLALHADMMASLQEGFEQPGDDEPLVELASHIHIRLTLVSGDWAAELVLMTPWMLPAVQEWHKSLEPAIGARVTPTCDVAVHHRGGEGEFAVGPGGCHVFPEARCQNVPVSSFEGGRLYDLLVAEGEEKVWTALAELIMRESGKLTEETKSP
jgi:hypothetical protein